MRFAVLIIPLLFFSISIMSETTMKDEISDTFVDKVKDIKIKEQEVTVEFQRHSAIYRLAKSNPRFSEIKEKLELSQNKLSKLKITAKIPKMEILDVTE